MANPLVSIVLPTRNGMATLPAVLDAVAAQRTDCGVELVAIDTESTDGTLELLQQRAWRVMSVARAAFNHGTTRNQAIAATRGDFIVLLSQDAQPANEAWLETLVAPLRAHSEVAGTFARQLSRPDAAAIARWYHANWVGSSSSPRASRFADREAYERLAPIERMVACTFDNVCSCIRRDVWAAHPFTPTPIAEDLEWSKTVLLAGYEIRFVPAAEVWHSHRRTARYEFQRTALLHQRLHDLFGVRTIPTPAALLRAVAATTRLHLRCRREATAGVNVESVGRALALAIAWPVGQYVGGRRGFHGLPPIAAHEV